MEKTRRRGAATLAVLAVTAISVAAPSSLAGINVGPGKGNPETNASGKCPGGQNKDTSVGGLKKC